MSVKGRKRWAVLKAVEVPSTYDIAWAAGFIEGDGCIWGGSGKTATEISVNQKDGWVIARLQALFGGAVGLIHNQGFNHATYWRWRVSGSRARGLGMTIYTFLSPQKQQQVRNLIK